MANVNDSAGLSAAVEKERDDLADADLAADEREAIEKFVAYRDGRVSRNTLRQDMGNLRRAAEANPEGSLLDLDSPSDVDRIIAAMPRVSKAETKNTYNRSLRVFYSWATSEGYGDFTWAEDVEDYQVDASSRRLKREDYLTGDEVTELIDATNHPRDETLIEFLADTGARINVVTNLRVGDVDLDGDRVTFRPNPEAEDGYKGIEIKRYPVLYSERHLRRWVNRHHPDRHSDAPLFPVKAGYDKTDRENMAIAPNTAGTMLKRVAENTSIDGDRVHPHAFRHAAVRRMKTDPDFDFDWESVKLRVAWSDRAFEQMKQLYGELEEDEQLDYFYRRAGHDVDPDEREAGESPRRECWSCGTMNRVGADFCDECGRALDPEAAESKTITLDGDASATLLGALGLEDDGRPIKLEVPGDFEVPGDDDGTVAD